MSQRRSDWSRRRLFAGLACASLLCAAPCQALAQAGFGAVGGVYFDAEGMLRESSVLSPGERLQTLRAPSAGPSDGPVTDPSSLRKVSLRRLEAAVARRHAAGQAPADEMEYLAGLCEVRYLFFEPSEGDVILAGPAEGWRELPEGDLVGRKSARPVLRLDDLLVALRFAFAAEREHAFLGCSIEPTTAGVARHDEYLSRVGAFDGSRAAAILDGMVQAMGPQQVVVYGAPPTSHWALTMLAADYRLKRLALAHDPSPSKKVPSYLDLAARGLTGGPQPQHRWWFVGRFEAIRHTADRLAFELEGPGLAVETAPTAASFNSAQPSARPSRAATQFAEAATRALPELAAKIPSFAALQNLAALAVCAELIRQSGDPPESSDAGPRSAWRPAHFLDGDACPIDAFQTPRLVPSLANVRAVKGRHWLFSISGGVELNPAAAAGPETLQPAEGTSLDEARRQSLLPADGRWWWD